MREVVQCELQSSSDVHSMTSKRFQHVAGQLKTQEGGILLIRDQFLHFKEYLESTKSGS